jgi:hypothetical protein
VTDRDLRELQRRANAAPEDGAARLDLARAWARAGQRDDAVEACYRARLCGGDAELARELLRSLGAPCSPWSHSDGGDAANTRCAPVRGPRKGEVVASVVLPSAGPVVIAEDGSVVVGQDGGVMSFLDGRTLAVRDEHDVPGTAMATAEDMSLGVGPGERLLVQLERSTVFELNERRQIRCLREHGSAGPLLVTLAGDLVDPGIAGPALGVSLRMAVRGNSVACAFLYSDEDDPRLSVVVRLLDGMGREQASAHFPAALRRPVRVLDAPIPIALDKVGRAHITLGAVMDPGDAGATRFHSELLVLSPNATIERTRSIPLDSWESRYAVQPDGSSCALCRNGLLRFGPDAASIATPVPFESERGVLITDRDSFAYASSSSSLAAFDPDGHKLFELPSPSTPVAIDGLNRLLAVRPVEAGVELIAIA